VISFLGSSLDPRIAKCANPACSGVGTLITATNLASPDEGYATAIAIGNDGFPRISYTTLTLNTLKFLKCDTRSCQ
jgi:hypothetical protein